MGNGWLRQMQGRRRKFGRWGREGMVENEWRDFVIFFCFLDLYLKI